MTLLFILLWLIPTVVTFRYTGYANNVEIIEGPHENAVLCSSCKCVTCGLPRSRHSSLYRRIAKCNKHYSNSEGWVGMHPSAVIFGGLEALLWPLTWTVYLLKEWFKGSGMNELQFFKPPPEIRSRDERRAAREAAKAKLIEVQAAEIKRLIYGGKHSAA